MGSWCDDFQVRQQRSSADFLTSSVPSRIPPKKKDPNRCVFGELSAFFVLNPIKNNVGVVDPCPTRESFRNAAPGLEKREKMVFVSAEVDDDDDAFVLLRLTFSSSCLLWFVGCPPSKALFQADTISASVCLSRLEKSPLLPPPRTTEIGTRRRRLRRSRFDDAFLPSQKSD